MLLEQGSLNARLLPWPTDWAALFGAARPLIVEIGFGRGAFLRHLAMQHPGHNLIGLEISNQCMDAAERMIARERLANVRLIHATAETAFYHLFEPASIAAVHINFPDPWFKQDHRHRRLMQPEMVRLLIDRMAPGAELYLATDIAEYAQQSSALLAATPELTNLLPGPWAHHLPGRVLTKYETIALREGRTCYYFAYRRNDTPGPNLPVGKELAMPHAVVHLPLTLDEIASAFTPIIHAEGGLHAHVIDVYRGRLGLLFEAHLNEPTIRQHVMLALHPYSDARQPNLYTLHLAPVGQPRATIGAHLAVRALRDWLLSLHPEAALHHDKLRDT